MIFKNKRYSNKYNKNVIKNSVTVYADSIGNTEINREAIWITLVEQYKRSFNSFLIRQRAYIRYVVGIGLFYFGWMWIKIRRRRINRQSARHESKLVKVFLKARKGRNGVSASNDLKLSIISDYHELAIVASHHCYFL